MTPWLRDNWHNGTAADQSLLRRFCKPFQTSAILVEASHTTILQAFEKSSKNWVRFASCCGASLVAIELDEFGQLSSHRFGCSGSVIRIVDAASNGLGKLPAIIGSRKRQVTRRGKTGCGTPN